MRRYLILFLPVLLLLCSCAEEVHYPVTLQNKKKFTKKVKAPLELTRGVARLDYVSGKSGQKILFLLRNKGLSAVNIDEWYMNEPDNIRLYYARCEKGKSAQLKDSDFICVWPEDSKTSKKAAKNKHSGRRMPLCLTPSSAALIETPMEFLRTFPLNGKPIVTIAVKAKLNLQSVDVESPVYEIDVRPIVIQL